MIFPTFHGLQTGLLVIDFQDFADVLIYPVTCISLTIYLGMINFSKTNVEIKKDGG